MENGSSYFRKSNDFKKNHFFRFYVRVMKNMCGVLSSIKAILDSKNLRYGKYNVVNMKIRSKNKQKREQHGASFRHELAFTSSFAKIVFALVLAT